MSKWKVIIDNGGSYAAGLPFLFDTEEEAQAYGEAWLEEFNRDNSLTEEDGGSFDVIEAEEEAASTPCANCRAPVTDGRKYCMGCYMNSGCIG